MSELIMGIISYTFGVALGMAVLWFPHIEKCEREKSELIMRIISYTFGVALGMAVLGFPHIGKCERENALTDNQKCEITAKVVDKDEL